MKNRFQQVFEASPAARSALPAVPYRIVPAATRNARINPEENGRMRVHKKQWWLLGTSAVSGVLVGVALPSVRQIVVSSVGPRLMAFEMLATAMAMMILSVIWTKVQAILMRWYVRIKCIELITLVPYYVYFMLRWNPRTYFLCEVIYYVVVSCALIKTANACQVVLFSNTQDRIDADNAMDFVWGLSSITGYGMACIVSPPIRFALALLLVSDFVSIAGKIITYRRIDRKEGER